MAIDPRHGQVSSLLNYLPAIFQEERAADQPNFLGRFLLAFERILLGLGTTNPSEAEDLNQPGIEEILGGAVNPVSSERLLVGIERYFEPGALLPGALLEEHERAPKEFLPWLASWVALTLRDDWDELRKRDLIAKVAQLYRLRGTKRGVEEFLRIYTRLGAQIDELNMPFQLGDHSRVGVDTILDGGAPFFFVVTVSLPTSDTKKIREQREIATAIVDLQKPAHCDYRLEVATPIFQINVHSRVGMDTLLGETVGRQDESR